MGTPRRASAHIAHTDRSGSQRSLRGLLAGLLVAVCCVTAGALQSVPRADAATPGPIPEGRGMVWVSQNDPTRLFPAVQTAAGMTFGAALGQGNTRAYNAVGYRVADRYLYGMQSGTNRLVRIGNDGETSFPFATAVAGIPARDAQDPSFNQGSFGGVAANGADFSDTLLIRLGHNSTRLYGVDVATNTSQSFTLSAAVPNVADFVWKDGALWALNSDRRIYQISPPATTGGVWSVRSFDLAGLPDPAGNQMLQTAYGAQWLYGNGNIGVSANGSAATSKFYQIKITNPNTTDPTFHIVSMSTGPTSQLNDGASYLGADVDLGIVKSAGSPVWTPGGQISYDLIVTNHSTTITSSGYTVSDTLPASLTAAATTTPGCAIQGQVLSCAGAELGPGASRTISVSASVTAAATGCIDNLAVVVGNESDGVPGNDSSIATVCPPPTTGVTIVKTMHVDGHAGEVTSLDPATAPRIVAGASVTWHYIVTNVGEAPLTGIVVTDDQGVSVICPQSTLSAAEQMVCNGTGTVGRGLYGIPP